MSNTEPVPSVITCAETGTAARASVLSPRAVPLGGPRAMTVRRTLPQRSRSLIGAWCFVDHFGPDDVAATGGMHVPPHPHTALQTVTWLFSGEVEHRDTVGTHSFVRPGEVNLMTAGRGIAHSEDSTPATTVLHGAQLWVALPDATRGTAPAFEHHAPPELVGDGARTRVFVGSLMGHSSPVRTYSPLVGAEITLDPGASLTVGAREDFEYGVLVDTGDVTADGTPGTAGELLYLPPGAAELVLRAGASGPARVLLLGGEPLGEEIVMWWNFIGRDHDEVVALRERWQHEARASLEGPTPGARFGDFPAVWSEALPAPDLPNARLRPRGRRP
ncbi:pirin family protein [Actinorugispora endophytica]|uniref:Pirin n=1 Tax=Actinorugispora endophytica TaxID=1605990 RepID=A0A4R6UIS4_9ACTN|nr:pirin family protein [Actinorugispora endophytica]TDQ46372.1 hypothetical protein EV190_12559 [Actinorugispora endophytica]